MLSTRSCHFLVWMLSEELLMVVVVAVMAIVVILTVLVADSCNSDNGKQQSQWRWQ